MNKLTDSIAVDRRLFRIAALLLIVALSLALNLANNDFPLGFHADEGLKVKNIIDHRQNFNHPILMLQSPRAINYFLGIKGSQEVVELGRTINAVVGGLTVAACYMLFLTVSGPGIALIGALGVAVSPIMVIHAHYLKEDVLLVLFLMFSLYALIKFIESRGSVFWTLMLGVASGLAFSSHYKGIVLWGIYALVPALAWGKTGWWYPRRIAVVFLVALVVFMIVNFPAVQRPKTFFKGFRYEYSHAQKGHSNIKVNPGPFGYTFHFTRSLIPGMTAAVAVLGLAGLLRMILSWRSTDWRLRILLFYALAYYFIPEHSPLKPYPGFIRYMLPVAPILVFAALRLMDEARSRVVSSLPALMYALMLAMFVIVVAIPMERSIRLDYHLVRDTRIEADKRLEELGLPSLVEAYSSAKRMDSAQIINFNPDEERKKGVAYLVASEMMYGRYMLGASIPGQNEEVYDTWRKYEELFRKYPYEEIRPTYMSFAFSNPVIRIIDIREAR